MLTVVEGAERKTFGTLIPGCSIRATLSVHDPRTYSFATFGGSVGAAEAYIQGWWSADDLTISMKKASVRISKIKMARSNVFAHSVSTAAAVLLQKEFAL